MQFKLNKVSALVIALAIFCVILTFIVVPFQGGSILPQSLVSQATSTSTVETLPIISLSGQTTSILIATVMLGHVMLANLGLGGSWVLAIAELSYARSHRDKYGRLSRSLAQFNVVLFSTGATFAVGGLAIMTSLFPGFISIIFHLYFWPLFIEIISFVLEIFFLYVYYLNYDRISQRMKLILVFGYAITVFWQTFLINMVASAMLTPGADTISLSYTTPNELAWWFNPTMWILTFHRTAAAISYFGFVVGLLAMLQYKDKKTADQKAHWDWVGAYSIAWGLGGLIVQPVLGMIYAQLIQNVQPDMFSNMMHGSDGWEMLLMVGLLSALFLCIIVYFVERRDVLLSLPENAFLKKMFQIFLIVAAICAVILVQPAWFGPFGQSSNSYDSDVILNPLGIMSFKYIALFGLMLIGIIVLIVNYRMLKEHKDEEYGEIPPLARAAAIICGILGIWLVADMGFYRESARSPWLISGIIPIPAMSSTAPVTVPAEFAVFAALTIFTVLLFRLVARRTYSSSAYYAEEPVPAREIQE
jgi:cytochrome bd-type quinol oxidase subunit 1